MQICLRGCCSNLSGLPFGSRLGIGNAGEPGAVGALEWTFLLGYPRRLWRRYRRRWWRIGRGRAISAQVERDSGRDGRHSEAMAQPLGEACSRESRASSMTAWIARQPVIRDQDQRRMPWSLPRAGCYLRVPCTSLSASSRAGGTGTGGQLPVRRFFRLSKVRAPAASSTRSALSGGFPLILVRVSCEFSGKVKLLRKSAWRQVAERRMRPMLVVVDPPVVDPLPGIGHR